MSSFFWLSKKDGFEARKEDVYTKIPIMTAGSLENRLDWMIFLGSFFWPTENQLFHVWDIAISLTFKKLLLPQSKNIWIFAPIADWGV